MFILFRQTNIKLGTSKDGELRLLDASFIRAKFLEVFEYGIVILPTEGEDNHSLIEKVDGDCWKEPNTNIVYDYVEIREEADSVLIPQHLEIHPPPSRQF